MYFSRITLNPLADHQQLAQTICRDSYREHQVLWNLFDSDPDASRDFLYRQVIDHGRVKYYVLSKRIPADNAGLWCIDPPKTYSPSLVEGQKLLFMLRANPVVSVSTPEGKVVRHDVVMNEKKRIGYEGVPVNKKPSLQQLVQNCCVSWLESRADSRGFAFSADAVIADGYRQHESRPKSQKNLIRFSTVDFQGVLTVTNVERFRAALFSGIGKSKAFGCGLMLVRRI